ncbi:MAG: NifU family protein [Archangium gephyra]|uniref:NifU family protein n=1 Tax=Archangium gephyra TaxID=48 RepID=A0A2W5TJI3_9BACT|nr:MAG: NifU family protein [Archangium gephyra]
MSVNIQLEWTPNPSTLKYVLDTSLLPRGAMNFTSKEVANEKSPLAQKLFDIKGVTGVMLGTNFVTVTKGDEGEWDELNDGVMLTLDKHLTDGDVVVKPEVLEAWQAAAAAGGGGAVEQRIREILDLEIRPAVAMDGGDITLDRVENNTVYLHMQGSCAGCPSSTATLRMGIETRIKEAIPEIVEVVAV